MKEILIGNGDVIEDIETFMVCRKRKLKVKREGSVDDAYFLSNLSLNVIMSMIEDRRLTVVID